MLKVLIIEDDSVKAGKLKDFVLSFDCNTKVVSSKREAIAAMISELFDFALLDLFIPDEFGDEPTPENAYSLLQRLHKDRHINKPIYICGITRYSDIEDANDKFKELLGDALIKYEENSDAWQPHVRGKIEYLKAVGSMRPQNNPYNYDVAIITALQRPENVQLQKILSNNWQPLKYEGDDSTTYYTTEIQTSAGVSIRVVTAFQNQMASIATSMLTTKIIYNFRPRYMFMTGIAAAVKEEGVGYGDVLVATEVWNAANGKLKEGNDGKHLFLPDYRHEKIDTDFENIIEQISLDKTLLFNLREAFPSDAGKPNTLLAIHKGPMCSVPAVIAYSEVIKELERHDRNLLGIEMESYGLFYAAYNSIKPRPIYVASLKSVSDYATKEKNDRYQEYAAYTSAAVLKYIIEHCLKFD